MDGHSSGGVAGGPRTEPTPWPLWPGLPSDQQILLHLRWALSVPSEGGDRWAPGWKFTINQPPVCIP